jgi:hypothetical protein
MRPRDVALASVLAAGLGAVSALTCALPAATVKGEGGGGASSSSSSSSSSSGSSSSSSSGASSSSSGSSTSSSSSSSSGGAGVSGAMLVTAGGVTAPTGHASQHHVFWDGITQRWWLFYVRPAETTSISAAWSTNVQDWTLSAAKLSLGGDSVDQGDGRDFSVDLHPMPLKGLTVAHVAVGVRVLGGGRRHRHGRGILMPNTDLAFSGAGAPIVGSGVAMSDAGALDPEGGSILLLPDGSSVELGSWEAGNPGRSLAWRSIAPDDGSGSFVPSFQPSMQIEAPAEYVNARTLVPLGVNRVLAVWEDAAQQQTKNLRYATLDLAVTATWSSPAPLFTDAAMDANDWSAVTVTGGEAHVVRLAGQAFEHRRWNGTQWEGDTLPAFAGQVVHGRGVFVAGEPTQLVWAFAMSGDAGNPILGTRRKLDGSWTAWETVVAPATSGHTRSYLSGWPDRVAGQVALIWTELVGTDQYDVWGALVTPP